MHNSDAHWQDKKGTIYYNVSQLKLLNILPLIYISLSGHDFMFLNTTVLGKCFKGNSHYPMNLYH